MGSGDPADFEEFATRDAQAYGAGDDAFQENGRLMEIAEYTILNTGDLKTLRQRVSAVVDELRPGKGPHS